MKNWAHCKLSSFFRFTKIVKMKKKQQERRKEGSGRAEAPTRAEFLQKRLISAFFGFQWQNLAEILHLFKKYNYPRKVAIRE